MSRSNGKNYLIGTLSQMMCVCLAAALMRYNHISSQFLDVVFLIIGGLSSAFWGVYISIKSQRVNSVSVIIKDFFNIKQRLNHYGLVLIFISIIFGTALFSGRFAGNVKWYTFFILFLQAIVFGGIEEIGWRYTFQPIIEKKFSFEIACATTFVFWGIWHYMYFYLTKTIQGTDHIPFLIGLLGSCFVLGGIYKVTESLWLCVVYHCLLNTFSQILLTNKLLTTIVLNSIAIILSIVIVRKKDF